MKRCDILGLTPIPRDVALRMFAAMAARQGGSEVPGDDLRTVQRIDRIVEGLAASRETEEMAYAVPVGPSR